MNSVKLILASICLAGLCAACGDSTNCPETDNAVLVGDCYSGLGTLESSYPEERVTIDFRGGGSEGNIILTLQAGVAEASEVEAQPEGDVTPLRSFEVGETYDMTDGCGINFVNVERSIDLLEVTLTEVKRQDLDAGVNQGSISGTFRFEGRRYSTDEEFDYDGEGEFEGIGVPLPPL